MNDRTTNINIKNNTKLDSIAKLRKIKEIDPKIALLTNFRQCDMRDLASLRVLCLLREKSNRIACTTLSVIPADKSIPTKGSVNSNIRFTGDNVQIQAHFIYHEKVWCIEDVALDLFPHSHGMQVHTRRIGGKAAK